MDFTHFVHGIRVPVFAPSTGPEVVRRYVGRGGETAVQHGEDSREDVEPFGVDEDLIRQLLDAAQQLEDSELGRTIANLGGRLVAGGTHWVGRMKNVTAGLLQNVTQSNVAHRLVECLVFVKACVVRAAEVGLRYTRDAIDVAGKVIDQCVEKLGGWKTLAAIGVIGFLIAAPLAGWTVGVAAGVGGICGALAGRTAATHSPPTNPPPASHSYKRE